VGGRYRHSARQEGQVATPTSHPGAILLIDDDPTILEVALDVLPEEGYCVVSASTHEDGLTALRAVRFALVLCDTDGAGEGRPEARWSALERIRAAGETPVVIISAHAPGMFADFHERGFAGVIAKPFDIDELLATVRAVPHPEE
jgi:DNA-binding response OmpR family regulator